MFPASSYSHSDNFVFCRDWVQAKQIMRIYIANYVTVLQGASAVLIYGVPEAPLAQPRAVIGGHFISALIGLIILTIFRAGGRANESDTGIEPSLSWLAASLATSIAIVCMMASKTTHPPAGATALIPILDPKVYKLSWYFLPVVLLSSTLMVTVGLITNNIQKRYPAFWWEPGESPPQPKEKPSPPTTLQEESV
jgi:CBS-domain-containing membrane protein